MGIFPIVMNVIQFWIIDTIVKASGLASDADERGDSHDESRVPLFRGREEDDQPSSDGQGLVKAREDRTDPEQKSVQSQASSSRIV
jgi:hypothetical protein